MNTMFDEVKFFLLLVFWCFYFTSESLPDRNCNFLQHKQLEKYQAIFTNNIKPFLSTAFTYNQGYTPCYAVILRCGIVIFPTIFCNSHAQRVKVFGHRFP